MCVLSDYSKIKFKTKSKWMSSNYTKSWRLVLLNNKWIKEIKNEKNPEEKNEKTRKNPEYLK